jgi:hypothetical protein
VRKGFAFPTGLIINRGYASNLRRSLKNIFIDLPERQSLSAHQAAEPQD